jgi:CheY-like chemotaxis protein
MMNGTLSHTLSDTTCEVTLDIPFTFASGDQGSAQTIQTTLEHETVFFNRQILVVDDDPNSQKLLKTYMDFLGCQTTCAADAKEALDVLAEKEFDLCLMDIRMPDVDGLVTITQIRKNPQCQNLPVIAMTAAVLDYDEAQCKQAGADDFLIKPLDLALLRKKIKFWLVKKN